MSVPSAQLLAHAPEVDNGNSPWNFSTKWKVQNLQLILLPTTRPLALAKNVACLQHWKCIVVLRNVAAGPIQIAVEPWCLFWTFRIMAERKHIDNGYLLILCGYVMICSCCFCKPCSARQALVSCLKPFQQAPDDEVAGHRSDLCSMH